MYGAIWYTWYIFIFGFGSVVLGIIFYFLDWESEIMLYSIYYDFNTKYLFTAV